MRIIKLALSWFFYYMGDITSKCITMHDTKFNYMLACMYQWLMMKSYDLQNGDKRGPWGEKQ